MYRDFNVDTNNVWAYKNSLKHTPLNPLFLEGRLKVARLGEPNLKELFLKYMRLDMSIVIVAWLLNLGLS